MRQTIRATRSASLLALVLAAFPLGGQETAPRAMTAVDLISIPQLSDPRLAPQGDRVAFVLSEANWEENRRISHLWLADVAGGESVQLTFGEKGERSPRWSPDGEMLAFLARRGDDEHEQIYGLPSRGGEARRLFEHETAPSQIRWSDDGNHLYFLASDPKTAEQKRRDERKDDVFAFDENYQHRHLHRARVADGSVERLTEGDLSVLGYDLARDGRALLHTAPTPLFDDSDESEIRWLAADGTLGPQLTKNGVREGGARVSPDGARVSFTASANDAFEDYYNSNVFLVAAAGGPSRVVGEASPYGFSSVHWSATGSLLALANTGARSQLVSIDSTSGAVEPLTQGDHSIRGWHYLRSRDTHVFQRSTPTNPGDVMLLRDGQLRQVTHVFDDLEQTYRLPRQELITWTGADGVRVEGLVTHPLDAVEGQPSPLVVQTHGGPAASDKFGFGRWINYPQVLAARGWMVLQPNYRGSTGYGDDFLRDMVGGYFRQAHLDVMRGVDALVERGLADPERMVKMGWSAGGHMTNKIVTHTERFRAASSGAGASNWISMYGQSDVRIYRTPWFGGTPWQEDAPISTYWEHSPLRDVWKVKTPTLLLVGENDLRVPAPQSVEFYRALRSNGVDTHLYMAPREGHGWRELRHELFKVNVELEWFEKHALGREYEWERAPGDEEEDEAAGSETSAPTMP